MTNWTKDMALTELGALADESLALGSELRFSANHTRWLACTLSILEEIFGRESGYYQSMRSLTWQKTGPFFVGGPSDPQGAMNPQMAVERLHQAAYAEQLDTARGLLLAATDHLNRTQDITTLYQGKDTPPESSLILKIINIAERQLRKVIRDAPDRERVVQDAFENILIGAEIPYSRETDSIEYSSKRYIPDFSFYKIDLTVEIKLCNREGRQKEIISEINDDIMAYRTKFGNLVFVVYDIGFIRDVDLFGETFERHSNVVVRVVKH